MTLRFALVGLVACFGLNWPGLANQSVPSGGRGKILAGLTSIAVWGNGLAGSLGLPAPGIVEEGLTLCDPREGIELSTNAWTGPAAESAAELDSDQGLCAADGFRIPVLFGVAPGARDGAVCVQQSRIEIETEPAVAQAVSPVVEDAIFAGVVTEMSLSFAAEAAVSEPVVEAEPAPEAPESSAPASQVAEILVPAFPAEEKLEGDVEHDPYPGLAFALNAAHDGIGEEVVADDAGEPVLETADVDQAVAAESPARLERLASAVRLTGQALQAWVSIFQQTPPETSEPAL